MYRIAGDPTEGALLTLSEKVGITKDELNNNHKRVAEIPFDSTRKMMTTFNENVFHLMLYLLQRVHLIL